MKRSRIWVVLAYAMMNTWPRLMIQALSLTFYFFAPLLYIMIMLIFAFVGLFLSGFFISKFNKLIRGTRNLELLDLVRGAFSYGYVFSMILGLGGSFYVSIWIIVMKIFSYRRKDKYNLKIDERYYWKKITSFEKTKSKNLYQEEIKSQIFMDLVILFFFFYNPLEIIEVVRGILLMGIIIPIIFVLNVILDYSFNKIDFKNLKHLNDKQGFIILILIKFILIIALFFSLSVVGISAFLFTFILVLFLNLLYFYHDDVRPLILAVSIFSFILNSIIPLFYLNNKSRKIKNVKLYKTSGLLLIIIYTILASIVIGYILYMFFDFYTFIVLEILITALFFLAVYYGYITDLKEF